MNLVWESDIQPLPRRMTILALADAANVDGVCWPTVDLLVERTGAGRSTVLKALTDLVREGFLIKQRRRSKSTVYTIVQERLQQSRKSDSETSHREASTSETSRSQSQKVQDGDVGKSTSETLLKRTTNKNHQGIVALPFGESNAGTHATTPPPMKRATRLPGSWTPTDEHRGRAHSLGLDVDDEAETFRLHAETNGRTTKNWNSAFTMWLKKALVISRGRNPAVRAPVADRDTASDWVRVEWKAGRVKPIEDRTGLRYTPPDLPMDIAGRDAVEDFHANACREWIAAHHDVIIDRLTAGSTP